jgi:type I restriction-modification system DNA methylase subunit
MSRLEKTTDLIVFNQLRLKNYVDGDFNELDKKVKVWAKKSSNRKINDILSKSSKKGTGQKGFPEYLIYDEKEKIVIVIENKKDLNKHFYENADEKVSEYAVNGALWYASFLKEEFNVIAIGISGNKTEELKIDSFAWRKGVETFTNLNLHELSEIKVYRDIINKSIKASKSRNSLIELNEKAIEINEFLRNILGVIEHERLYVVGSILFALEDPVFKISYGQINSDNDLAVFIFQTIERKIKGSKLEEKELIANELRPVLLGLKDSGKEKVKELYPNGALLELVKNVDNILFDFYKNSELDMISTFFNVFLSYSTSGGSDLGIVLTPSHITSLFCDLVEFDLNHKVLDICAGTGGFLTSSWKRISLNNKLTFSQKEEFRKNNIFGIEKEKSIYTIIALNMFLNKDGRSNLHHGDAFTLKDKIKEFECNIGFINPPYSDSIYSEISFVELMLDSLLPNSTGIAIIPVNSVSSRTKKHSGLNTVKERILKKHKLLASIQMPNQLFYPKGTETIILVFQTGIPNENHKTWFAKYDDGYKLIKHKKTRTPSLKSEENHKEFIQAYKSKEDTIFSFNKEMTSEDQWVYTIHYDVSYNLETIDFQETLNEYVSYLFLNNYL